MALHWVKEEPPRWDADKQRLFGREELAATGYEPPSPGSVIADEWWRVTDDAQRSPSPPRPVSLWSPGWKRLAQARS
jgi:hypothetical protein